jgi:hypothetical protein
MVKSLYELIDPQFLNRPEQPKVLKNPTYTSLSSQHSRSVDNFAGYKGRKSLRYIAHEGDVWTADASRIIHYGIAQEAGLIPKGNNLFAMGGLNKMKSGYIENDDLPAIHKHPDGIKGWVRDRHKNGQEFIDSNFNEECNMNELVDPQFLSDRRQPKLILSNPTHTALTNQLNNSDPGGILHHGTKALRYVADKNYNVHTGDATRMIHDDIARESGMTKNDEDWFNDAKFGYIKKHDLPYIKNHPQGLKGWVKDRHEFAQQNYISHMRTTIGAYKAWIQGRKDRKKVNESVSKDIQDRLIPAIKYKDKLFLGKRGDEHYDVIKRHKVYQIQQNDPENDDSKYEFKHDIKLVFHDPKTKRTYTRYKAGVDTPDLMTPLQRFRKYGNEETIHESSDIVSLIKKEGVPALKHRISGKVIMGRRGDTHADIGSRTNEFNVNAWHSGFADPTTKKFYMRDEVDGMDSSELMSPKQYDRLLYDKGDKIKQWLGATNEDFNGFRNSPTIKNPSHEFLSSYFKNSKQKELRYIHDGKDAHVSDAYEMTHEDMADAIGTLRSNKVSSGYLYANDLSDIKKQGIKAWAKTSRWERRNEETINENYENIIPAGRIGDKIYKGEKGKTHGYILQHYILNNKEVKKDYDKAGGIEWGYYHTKDKKFKTREEMGDLDTTDLMTPLQRFKKFGNEETINEMMAADIVHHNISVSQLKALSANVPKLRYVIGPDNRIHAGNAENFIHMHILDSKINPQMRGYLHNDNGKITHHPSYSFNTDKNEFMITKNLQHLLFDKFEKAGIKRVEKSFKFEM